MEELKTHLKKTIQDGDRDLGWALIMLELAPEEIELQTLRRQGFTSLEICSMLEMSLDRYEELHNDIEEKIARITPIDTSEADSYA